MKLYLVYLTVFFSVFKLNDGFLGKTFTQFQELVLKQRKSNALKTTVGEVEGYAFDQTLDHFEVGYKARTFRQRFWRNKVYWRKEDGPVFLYVGGEGALDGVEIYGGHIVDMAAQYGALLFSVEHRFYGRSTFKDCLKDENLKLLSSEQALADLSVFVEFAKDHFGLTDKHRWFVYGGSYPGSLAAWFRIKYPHLVFGAVASSAPVKAQVNFEGYNNVVKASLSNPIVGGSDQCADNLKTAFQTMENLVAKKSFINLKTDFKSCNDISNSNDTWTFFLNVASFIMGIVQYNEQVSGLEISSLCKRMTNASSSPYDNLAKLYQDYIHQLQTTCIDNSYTAFINELKDTSVDPLGNKNTRQWIYQTCTQFGYYQTCDKNTKCLFSNRLTLAAQLLVCEQVFSFQNIQTRIQKRVNFTDSYYGSDKPRGSRIIFVNGSIDPWHSLSILQNVTSSQMAIFINGTSHCQNMNPSEYNDPPALKEARQRVSKIIGQWLKLEEKSI